MLLILFSIYLAPIYTHFNGPLFLAIYPLFLQLFTDPFQWFCIYQAPIYIYFQILEVAQSQLK